MEREEMKLSPMLKDLSTRRTLDCIQSPPVTGREIRPKDRRGLGREVNC